VPELVVATFNVHAGIDGWGRPFDVVSACGELDADVLFLEENWTPEQGKSIASLVGESHGYEVHEAPLSDALLFEPSRTGSRWGPTRHDARSIRPLFVNDALSLGRVRRRRRDTKARLGSWGIAVLSRVPVKRVETVELGRLSRDSFRLRAALFADLELEGSPLTVVGTHLAHFVHGSPLLVNRLRRRLPVTSRPGVLCGDMNFWGPPVSLALPGWRRAVRTRTYPSWRAHSQIDHILVTGAVQVLSGESVRVGRSDHLPVRARLAIA
jgi:endonuclease/exonuclease/phosphatase family metal-dependent hydrolase